jgi:hypothetical protein
VCRTAACKPCTRQRKRPSLIEPRTAFLDICGGLRGQTCNTVRHQPTTRGVFARRFLNTGIGSRMCTAIRSRRIS